MPFFSDQTFQNLQASDFQPGEYDSCTFTGCNLSNLNLHGSSFENCTFKNCDLSNAKVSGVSLQMVRFEHCKILGVHFNSANPFLLEFHFDGCQLDYCNFFNLKLKKSVFKACRLLEVDFSQADLGGASFVGSDLSGTVFDRSQLEKADFREALHYRIDPETNKIKGARFDLEGLPGLLGKWGIKID
ncbi:pentapeptide repeat-containing protein [Algoriphagus sp. H41]|uniref:Pentapeptide repeat-containing protein n=1 Tax=Algoriphagus oliviformis TaxID=2811231 RepID=A0ABS3C6C9_9BACT|nr:pentapeptide repeat-containing protein [Algoriphagus oliviformis]MBN7812677.1 pentapeptide repeat-containing protein [Algoriphagus oliviformis]